MERLKLIRSIIELHNIFIKKWYKSIDKNPKDSLWNLDLIDATPDRYYIVEHLQEIISESNDEDKKYIPAVEVRYYLRSKEARAYGKDHQAFYDRYLSTVSISYSDLENPDKYEENLSLELNKLNVG